MQQNSERKLGKWHVIVLALVLYALTVMVSMLSHQPPEVMNFIIKQGAGGVGFLVFVAVVFG